MAMNPQRSLREVLLDPATRLMDRMRILPKFVLISSLVLLPLLALVVMLQRELMASADFARKERVGAGYVGALVELSRQLQLARAHANVAAASDDSTLRTALAQKQNDVNAQFKKIDGLAGQIAMLGMEKEWGALASAWGNAAKATGESSDAQYTKVSIELQKHIKLAASRSNLAMDPDIDSFYLMNAVTSTLMTLASDLEDIRSLTAAAIARKEITLSDARKISELGVLSRRAAQNAMSDIDSAMGQNPDLATSLAAARQQLDAVNAMLTAHAGDVSAGELFNLPALDYIGKAGQSVDTVYGMAAQASRELERLLDARLDALQGKQFMAYLPIVLSVLVSGYFMLAFYAAFRRSLGMLEVSVKRMHDGDLGPDPHTSIRDELGDVLRLTGAMKGHLASMISEVRDRAALIDSGSREIATGNADLSERTESQASSLEETASSIEELTSTVRQNADNARSANELVVAATGIAGRGGEVVMQVVDTMGSIKQSSARIEDIISVIDSIAFQTNILALNAAVEAARAGEQGRGFAVVAAEVRTLAQRSAGAAREIKELIGDSVEKVEVGSRLVDQAGQTMEDIVTSVQRVASIMSEIAAASQEQSAGIEEVNRAITQMDEMTQQNAALVEQAAAAAASMQDQADALARAVSVFKLEQGKAGASSLAQR